MSRAAVRVLSALLVLSVALSAAAQNKRRMAITDRSDVDEDFAYQGEYMGYVRQKELGRWYWRHVGLQVVARGGGEFDATLYAGGLPGAGWNRRGRRGLSGGRDGNLLLLHGEEAPTIAVHGDWAEFRYGGGGSDRIEKIRRISPTLGAPPPPGAVVLFDGTGTDNWQTARMTGDGLLMQGALTKEAYTDFTLHLEFRLPYMPYARGQGRANSGVYLQRRYEVQILDSFGLQGEANECGGLYRYRRPDVNMCYPPLRWQTYDIVFTAARFDEAGNKVKNARVTVRHNGEPIHDDVELERKTGAGRPEGPNPLPTLLQDHGNPVRFRNIWLLPHDGRSPIPAGPKSRAAEGHVERRIPPAAHRRGAGLRPGYFAAHPNYSGGGRYVVDYRRMAHPRYSGYRP